MNSIVLLVSIHFPTDPSNAVFWEAAQKSSNMIRACVAALCEGGCWTLLVGGDYNAELSMDDWIVGGRCGGMWVGQKVIL